MVLVHGTSGTQQEFFRLAPRLESAGYCTYALNYGCTTNQFSCGRGRIQASARELDAFIDRKVLPQSRSGKVSIVGHSQGGLMSRYFIRFLGGRSLVRDMIGLSPSNHGTDNPLAPFAQDCPACRQQHPYMSDLTRRVNADDETLGNISYTHVQTRYDEVVIPYFSAYLADKPGTTNGPRTRLLNGPRTTNYCLQDQFPADTSEHNTIVGDDQAYVPVLDALGRSGPARPPARPDSVCARFGGDVLISLGAFVVPGGGGPNGGRPGAGRGPGGGPPSCTISGSSSNDALVGTRRKDVICAGAGNDVVRGLGGNDTILAGSGNDTLRCGGGGDDLAGDSGNDTLNSRDGVRGNDSINGNSGRDACSGDVGDGRSGCP